MTAHRQIPHYSALVIRQPGGTPSPRIVAARDIAETAIVSVIEHVCALHRVRSLPAVRIEADNYNTRTAR